MTLLAVLAVVVTAASVAVLGLVVRSLLAENRRLLAAVASAVRSPEGAVRVLTSDPPPVRARRMPADEKDRRPTLIGLG